MARNPSRGPRKNGLRKIENKDDRLVTFSKRRSGIYRKASELIAICGAKIGILLFSETGKPYTYGAPDFETISSRFAGTGNNPSNYDIASIIQGYKQEKAEEVNTVYDELSSHLDILKKEGDRITKVVQKIKSQFWWETPVENLTQAEMEQLTKLMENMKTKSNEKAEELALL